MQNHDTCHIADSIHSGALCGASDATNIIPNKTYFAYSNCRACLALQFPQRRVFHARQYGKNVMYCGMTSDEVLRKHQEWSIPDYFGGPKNFAAHLTCEQCYAAYIKEAEKIDA